MSSNARSLAGAPIFGRRRLLQIAGPSYLGLSLGGLLRAQAAHADTTASAPRGAKIRSCIIIFYYGGPSHIDTWDMKPDAPVEVRGEFKPIATSVPGLHVCEHLPRLARMMDKVALVRSMHHQNRLHDSASTEVLTGRQSPNGDREEFAPIAQFFPAYGATLSYLWRSRSIDFPHIALPFTFHNVIDVPCQGGGFLGSAYNPPVVGVDPEKALFQLGPQEGAGAIGDGRLRERLDLLATVEHGRATTAARQMQRYYSKAMQLLHSDALGRALDLRNEDPKLRARYGFGPSPVAAGEGPGGGGAERGYARQVRGQSLLLARRLVEAGIPFINVYDFQQQGSNWDSHFKVASQHKNHLLPLADQGLSALLEDLEARGLLDTTLVVALGEFGRTPRINKDAGRDHWPDCYTILMAGGGVKGGYIHGASDRLGAYPALDPVTPADLAATIFWRFGIDPKTEIHDLTGRPFKVADGEPIRALFHGEA